MLGETCRICYSDEEPLVLKCGCRGSSAWVHDHCLAQWRRSSLKPEAAYRCDTCKTDYLDSLSLELLEVRLQNERTSFGSQHTRTLTTMREYAVQLKHQQHYAVAEPLHREVLGVCRQLLGNAHEMTLTSVADLGILLQARGEFAAAEVCFREDLASSRESLGRQHQHTMIAINNLATVLSDQDKRTAAEPLYREALEIKRRQLGPRHPSVLLSINNLALFLFNGGELAAAEPLFREAADALCATLGSRHPYSLATLGNLADLLREMGQLEEAWRALGESPRIASESLGAEHEMTLVLAVKASRLTMARTSDAAPMREAVRRLEAVLGAGHAQTRKYAAMLPPVSQREPILSTTLVPRSVLVWGLVTLVVVLVSLLGLERM